MKIQHFFAVGLCLLAGNGFQAAAQDINPALYYYQAFLVGLPKLSEADEDYRYSSESISKPLPERFSEYVTNTDTSFSLLRNAAKSTAPCDWGIDFSDGPSTRLAHLAKVKQLAIAGRTRIIWELEHQQQKEACEDWLAILTLARNTSRDGTLIGTLVQYACEAIDYSLITQQYYKLTPDTCQTLLKGLDSAPGRGPMTNTIATEKKTGLDWLLRRIKELQKENGSDDAKTLNEMSKLFLVYSSNGESDTNTWNEVYKAANGISDGIAKLVLEADPLTFRLMEIMPLPHGEFEAKFSKFKADLDRSPNPIFKMLYQSWDKAAQKRYRTEVSEAMVRAALDYKAHGEAAIKAVKDPCGDGPLAFRRFVFKGEDRGFELKSALILDNGKPVTLIFVEKAGPLFYVDGIHAGEPRDK